jgi:hypothetical protein
MPKINKALAILAALAFFLPFISISCGSPYGKLSKDVTGAKLVQYAVNPDSAKDMFVPDLRFLGVQIPNSDISKITPGGKVPQIDGANLILFASFAALAAAAALFMKGRAGELLSDVASIAAIVLLFMFHSKLGDPLGPWLTPNDRSALQTMHIQLELQFSSGFWLSVIISAASAILAFKGSAGVQRSVPIRATPSASGPTFACPACGAANPVGNKFCLSCGGSLLSPPPPAPPANRPGVTCPSCGAANVPESKFCLSCGKPLATPASSVQPDSAPTTAPPAEARAAAAAVAPMAQSLPFTASAISEKPSTETRVEAPAPVPAPQAAAGPTPATPQSTGAEPPKSNQICGACGAAVAPTQKFCLACGTPVGEAAKAPEATPTTPTPTREAAALPAISSSNQYQAGPFQTPLESGSKMWLMVVVLVVILGAAGWLVWRYFAGPDVTVTAIPQRIHVAAGGKTLLQASVSGSNNADVIWSIQEGAKGGQITPFGAVAERGQARASATYIAPQSNGVFHVIATSHANSNRMAKVEIIVGSAPQPDAVVAPTPAPTAALATNPNAPQILGTWRWPSGDMTMTIAPDSTIAVTSDADPQKSMQGTYHFTDNSHLQVDFGNGDVRTWEILGVDSNYLRVLSQSKTESSPTAMVFVKIRG